MTQPRKRQILSKYIDDKTRIELTLYGQRVIKCLPVRLIGNVLNYKLRTTGNIYSVPMVDIHTIKLLGGNNGKR